VIKQGIKESLCLGGLDLLMMTKQGSGDIVVLDIKVFYGVK
jgi:hypothetical protein